MFAGTVKGAEASASLYSLIETAKANNCEPYCYLCYVFTHLPLAKNLADFEALFPWNFERGEMFQVLGLGDWALTVKRH